MTTIIEISYTNFKILYGRWNRFKKTELQYGGIWQIDRK